MQSAIRDYDDLGDGDNGPWAPVADESSEVEDTTEIIPIPTPAPTSVPAPKEAPVEIAPTPSASEPSPAVNDPTMHIIEPDEEEEKWERVNERKLHTVLPPRAARGTAIAPVRLLFCFVSILDNFTITGKK